jgi:NADH dehydrogenase FAD-containing subunit
LRKLRQNGIKVRLETSAKKVDSVAVHLTSGERIETGMIVCTVGTETHPLIKGLGLPLEKGRLKTDPDMKVRARPISGPRRLFACSQRLRWPAMPRDRAVRMQQARQLAENLKCALARRRDEAI